MHINVSSAFAWPLHFAEVCRSGPSTGQREEDRNRKAEEAEEPEAKKKKMTIVEDDEDYETCEIEWLHAEENDDLPENVFD